MRSIDVNEYEGAVYIPTISGDSGRAFFVVTLFHWLSGRQSSTWTLTIHPRLSPYGRPRRRRRLPNVSVSVSRLKQTVPERRSFSHRLHLLAIIVPRHRLLHRLNHRSHTRLPRHRPYQNSCPRATLPLEAHTCVGTR